MNFLYGLRLFSPLVDGANSTQKLPTAEDRENLAALRPDLLE